MAEHLNIFGIGNDPEMVKLLEVLNDFEVPHTFFDYRDHPPTDEQLKKWADYMNQDFPNNGRSTLFKKSERLFLKLTTMEQNDWLRKHYQVIERPIVEDENFEILIVGARPERILKELCNIKL
jgi:arsenate reductase-like glutaredoxin family protein